MNNEVRKLSRKKSLKLFGLLLVLTAKQASTEQVLFDSGTGFFKLKNEMEN
jgi:hypothetical protein